MLNAFLCGLLISAVLNQCFLKACFVRPFHITMHAIMSRAFLVTVLLLFSLSAEGVASPMPPPSVNILLSVIFSSQKDPGLRMWCGRMTTHQKKTNRIPEPSGPMPPNKRASAGDNSLATPVSQEDCGHSWLQSSVSRFPSRRQSVVMLNTHAVLAKDATASSSAPVLWSFREPHNPAHEREHSARHSFLTHEQS